MGTPNWVNRAIVTGDNLDILRKMNSESVDLIYLDPPFNSNRNYEAPVGSDAAGAAFKDTWTLSDLDKAWMGLIADTEPDMYQVVLAAGLAHGKGMQSYLCMMAVRLTEMRRVLRDTGSIYLHCDPTASHYLKMLMDVVFGRRNYINEVVWTYNIGGNVSKRAYGRRHDVLLFYAKSSRYVFNWDKVLMEWDEAGRSKFKYQDEKGRYRLIGRNLKDSPIASHRDVSPEWEKTHPELVQRYYMKKGKSQVDFWSINPINQVAKERVGFPTQKPLALLDRIIKASSNEGFMVLDPFCGCATALVAAEMHGRNWIGIDLSEKAAELVVKRVKDFQGLFQDITHYPDVKQFPDRNDVLGVKQSYSEMKHELFGNQEGHCNLCGHPFGYKLLELDHVIPKSKGGGDHIENRQLLCPPCNKLKGTETMEVAMAKYQETYANSPAMNVSHA